MAALIGTSGFDYAWWHGVNSTPSFYPENVPKKDYLQYYSKHFNMVEINSSFYRCPTANACKKWFSTTPDHFRFLLKFPRGYTHYFKDIQDVFPAFHTAVNELGNKLAGALLQFGPNFILKDSNITRLREASEYFARAGIQVYIELRHPSWFRDSNALNNTVLLCKELGWVLVITHTAKDGWLPGNMIQTCPGKIMVRMHGPWSHSHGDYSIEQLKNLATQLENIPHKIITFNNTDTYDGQCCIKDVHDDAGRAEVMEYMSNYGWSEMDFLAYFIGLSARGRVTQKDLILRPKTLDYINIHAIKNATTLSALMSA